MNKLFSRYLFITLIAFFYFNTLQSQNNPDEMPGKIRASFIYNFAKSFSWPEKYRSTEFRVGILIKNPILSKYIEEMSKTKKIGDLPIKVIFFKNASEITFTEILVIDYKQNPELKISNFQKGTLVITENDPDLNNVMLSFIDYNNNIKFACNEINIQNAGIEISPKIKTLAFNYVVSKDNKANNSKVINEYKNIFEKLSFSSKENGLNLTKDEANEILKTFQENKNTLTQQEKKLYDQKNQIDEQLSSIISKEKQLLVQEKKLDITIQQNLIQEKELENSNKEIIIKKEEIEKTKEILEKKRKEIDASKKELLTQLNLINSQRTILLLALFLMLLFITALIISIKSYRNKKLANELLQVQKVEIEKKNQIIEEKHKEIIDSINYAERIQRSFLATKQHLDEHLNKSVTSSEVEKSTDAGLDFARPDNDNVASTLREPQGSATENYFIFFKPKDVVSGDFYWSATLNNGNFILATADSTGHGVPGAIMSLLNITSLEKAVETHHEPSQILNATRKIIIERLKRDGSPDGGKDGMDCCLCVYDFNTLQLHMALANNPVWIVRSMDTEALEVSSSKVASTLREPQGSVNKIEVIEIKPDKMPVGKHDKQDIPFTTQSIQLQKGDVIYTLTDGFPDQFGGEKGKKFMNKNLRELLAQNAHLPMHEQKQLLENIFKSWIGNLEQVDDVTVIGVRV